ncbi:hypothetical protein [Zobellia galactanivorans]|uniref:Hypothetical lipoprotein n=2 Tax=Zobellia galactanivorans (strain DSM 12802 / CCUG 47099 / CIP 106680 / NCIMB 13871 / Dsij) TaxID=63186 RepID=G0L9A6_ZOBGA|nr:hypothetical protein [Zobellia galactanivorans]CAZ94461.1 Hypothetical lipoprotein [Zobellia galactanivorans]
MRYFIVWIILFPLAVSCQVKEVDLQGTWHYERRSRPETGFTMSIDGVDVTDELNDETGDGDGMDHFYLVFDGQGQLIEYKVGIGFRSTYKIVDNLIYSNGEPLYQIVTFRDSLMVIKQPDEVDTATYERVEVDLSALEIIN